MFSGVSEDFELTMGRLSRFSDIELSLYASGVFLTGSRGFGISGEDVAGWRRSELANISYSP
jgi:hypothetical protein